MQLTSTVCGLALYQHDHALCVKGLPHCPTCYEATLGFGQHTKLPAETTTLPSAGRTNNGRPAPPATRRRFAPPGQVILQPQPSKLSDCASRSNGTSTSSIQSVVSSSPAPLRDHPHQNVPDFGRSQLVKHKSDDRHGQLKETQGLYRDTVRNLAKRFELQGNPTADQAGIINRRVEASGNISSGASSKGRK